MEEGGLVAATVFNGLPLDFEVGSDSLPILSRLHRLLNPAVPCAGCSHLVLPNGEACRVCPASSFAIHTAASQRVISALIENPGGPQATLFCIGHMLPISPCVFRSLTGQLLMLLFCAGD